jgi:hypothetical protein
MRGAAIDLLADGMVIESNRVHGHHPAFYWSEMFSHGFLVSSVPHQPSWLWHYPSPVTPDVNTSRPLLSVLQHWVP